MTAVRTWLAHAVIAVVVGGGLVAIVTDTERWPFSPYAMYSWIRPASYTMPVLFGVPADAAGREFPLYDGAFVHPFDTSRLRDAFARRLRRPDPAPALREALADCLTRYERRRRARLHDGPTLRGVRLYQLTWALLPRASNLPSPEGRELLFEVSAP